MKQSGEFEATDEEVRAKFGDRYVQALIRLREGYCEPGDGELFMEVVDHFMWKRSLH